MAIADLPKDAEAEDGAGRGARRVSARVAGTVYRCGALFAVCGFGRGSGTDASVVWGFVVV